MAKAIKVSDPVYEYLHEYRDENGHTSVDSALRDVLRDHNEQWDDE